MGKDKEWLKQNIGITMGSAGDRGMFYSPNMSHILYDDLVELIDQLEEPETTNPTIPKKGTVEILQVIADREEEKLCKLKFISKTITETHYMAYRFFSGEYKPMTTNSMGLSNGAVGWRYIFTESELENIDLTGFEKVEVKE